MARILTPVPQTPSTRYTRRESRWRPTQREILAGRIEVHEMRAERHLALGRKDYAADELRIAVELEARLRRMPQ